MSPGQDRVPLQYCLSPDALGFQLLLRSSPLFTVLLPSRHFLLSEGGELIPNKVVFSASQHGTRDHHLCKRASWESEIRL